MKCSLEQQGMNFSIHIAELVKFLREDKAGFSLTEWLLVCGTRGGYCCKAVQDTERYREALEQIREADYIIEMAARAGYLTERQSLPIREECAALMTALVEANKEERR